MTLVRERLNPKNKRQITKDWQAQFPSLGTYRPMHLLRRVGPLVFGICLDRGSSGEEYYPIFHASALSRRKETVPLTLHRQIRTRRTNAPDRVVVSRHGECFMDAVARMREVSLLDLCGSVTARSVDEAYEDEVSQQFGLNSPHLAMIDHLSVLAWQDRTADAVTLCNVYASKALTFGERYWSEPGSYESWKAELFSVAQDVEGARRCVIEETEKHKLTKLPYSDLL